MGAGASGDQDSGSRVRRLSKILLTRRRWLLVVGVIALSLVAAYGRIGWLHRGGQELADPVERLKIGDLPGEQNTISKVAQAAERRDKYGKKVDELVLFNRSDEPAKELGP